MSAPPASPPPISPPATSALEDSFAGYGVGATLYMPVTHPRAAEILAGQAACGRASVVLCLEDALAEREVGPGLAALRRALARRAERPSEGPGGPLIFVRPRDLEMARQIADWQGCSSVAGFVAPKLREANLPGWLALARETGQALMPTLETAEYFDPAAVAAIRDGLAPERARIAAIRIGGNDLLGALGLRRERGVTAYEGPLAWVLPMMAAVLLPAGLPVAAPVFDVLDDLETLAREAGRDVAMGFVSKTAIHPAQVPVIERALAVCARDLRQAEAILGDGAAAVFQIGGAMCEPATHRAWAARIRARHARFGLRDEGQAHQPAEPVQWS